MPLHMKGEATRRLQEQELTRVRDIQLLRSRTESKAYGAKSPDPAECSTYG